MKSFSLRIPRGLLLACSLSLLFMVLSFARLLGDTQSPMFDHAAFKAVFEGPILGTRLASHIAWFITWLTALHLAMGVVCWLLARATLAATRGNRNDIRKLVALWFIATAAWLLAWNAGHYPRTSLGRSYAKLVAQEPLGIAIHDWLTLAFGAAVALTIAAALWRATRGLPLRSVARAAAWLAVPLLTTTALVAWPPGVAPASPDKPNVIFLGVDSLRYDEVLRVGVDSTTPNIDAFLEDAVRFGDAFTPLARTYPSWVSLLTGKHPHTTGAFLNLLPPDQVRLGQTLPLLLRANGYHSTYAIDEVRFSNIDESYGFDQAITPPIGSSDFIVGTMSDTPLLNLISPTVIGKWFFPHGYANRATNLIYDPDTFVERFRDDVHYAAPMFLAAHLTLPHWPYVWHELTEKRPTGSAIRPSFYQSAVMRADQQFGEILRILEARGLLRNAIVVAFSDHGESFHGRTDSLVPVSDATLAGLAAQPSWGHGTTVLSPHQFRILLAVRAYGPARALIRRAPGVSAVPATIEDIAPTVLDMLAIRSAEPHDGISLLPELRAAGSMAQLAQRVRFTETEFNPLNLVNMTGDVSVVNAKTFAEASRYYRVDPVTDRIEMKRGFLDTLRRNRQFAAIGRSQLLGVFPSPQTGAYTFLVVSLEGGLPRRIVSAEDVAGDAEVHELWRQICARYGAILDAGSQPTKCVVSPPVAAQSAAAGDARGAGGNSSAP